MRSDVRLEIYGLLSDPELLRDVIVVALEYAKGEWSDFIHESDEDPQEVLARYIAEIGEQGYPFAMDIDDSRYEFEDVRSAIRAASDVGYRLLTSSERLGFDYAYSFRPGWDCEQEGPIEGENSPTISYENLREAMLEGMDAVERLVQKAETACLLPEERGLTVPEEVYIAWQAAREEELAHSRKI